MSREKQIVKSNDWLTKGYSEEELAKMKEKAIKEAEAELRETQIEEMTKVIARRSKAFRNPNVAFMTTATKTAESLYEAGYRKQNDEELIDKIATYFEKEDNWTKLKYSWNACGKSVQLRDMLRDAICGAKMKGADNE